MKAVYLSAKAPTEVFASLDALGYEAVALPEYSMLAKPVASHCDMLLYPYKVGILTYRGYYEANRELFSRFAITLADIEPTEIYPRDIALNALSLGGKIYCLRGHTAREILQSGETVNVRQGYVRCSTLKIDEGAICTSDVNIAKAAQANGVEVTLIKAGGITLEGYGCGFIGGASVTFENAVGFFGELDSHPDSKKIAAAVESRGKKIISLCKGELKDFGGALII